MPKRKSDAPRPRKPAPESGEKKAAAERAAFSWRARRWGVFANVLAQTFLLALLLGGANFLSCRYYRRWDMTRDQRHSLSETSVRHLRSLSEPVEMIVAFTTRSPIVEEVKRVAREFAAWNPKVSLQFFDPLKNPNHAQEVATRFKLRLEKNVVIFATEENSRTVPEEKLVSQTDGDAEEQPLFIGEDVLLSGLIATVEGRPKDVRFVRDKGGLRRSLGGDTLESLRQAFPENNIRLKPFEFGASSAIPEAVDALLFLGVEYDLSRKELRELKTWWEDRRGALFFLLDPASDLPNLRQFLAENGVVPRKDRVLSVQSDLVKGVRKIFTVDAVFVPGSPITETLSGRANSQLSGQSCSLDVRENNASLRERNLSVRPLLEARADYWGERDFRTLQPECNPGRDAPPPIFLAASVEKSKVQDKRLGINSSRFVVVSNSSFLAPQTLTRENFDFFMSCLNWLLDRENLIGIAPRKLASFRTSITERQRRGLQMALTFLLPGAFFLTAGAVWILRRK